ncbi:hypothetical protein M8R20_07755 [Pseudomonas sp. R2.Fl]|nr:hypothetical protein [Pseudomonas sp. R2.Fl]
MDIIAPKAFLRLLNGVAGFPGGILASFRPRRALSERELCDIGLSDDPGLGDARDRWFRDLKPVVDWPPRFL